MNLFWHDFHYTDGGWYCSTCDVDGAEDDYTQAYHVNINFSEWPGFGKLWEWAEKQLWWNDFWWRESTAEINGLSLGFIAMKLVSSVQPDRFADAVYNYLKEIK